MFRHPAEGASSAPASPSVPPIGRRAAAGAILAAFSAFLLAADLAGPLHPPLARLLLLLSLQALVAWAAPQLPPNRAWRLGLWLLPIAMLLLWTAAPSTGPSLRLFSVVLLLALIAWLCGATREGAWLGEITLAVATV